MTLFSQIARFMIVGGLATVFHYAILVALVQSNSAEPVVASSIGFLLSAILNYLLNRRITFRSHRKHQDAIPRFSVVAFIGLLINSSSLWFFIDILAIHYMAAQLIATLIALISNFFLNRLWTFSNSTAA